MNLPIDIVFKIVHDDADGKLTLIRLLSKKFRDYVDKYYFHKLYKRGDPWNWRELPVTKFVVDLFSRKCSLLDFTDHIYRQMYKSKSFNYFWEKCHSTGNYPRPIYFERIGIDLNIVNYKVTYDYQKYNGNECEVANLKASSFWPELYYRQRHDLDIPAEIFTRMSYFSRIEYISKLSDERALYYIKLSMMCKIEALANSNIIRVRLKHKLYIQPWELEYFSGSVYRGCSIWIQLIDFEHLKKSDLPLYKKASEMCGDCYLEDYFYVQMLEHIVEHNIVLE